MISTQNLNIILVDPGWSRFILVDLCWFCLIWNLSVLIWYWSGILGMKLVSLKALGSSKKVKFFLNIETRSDLIQSLELIFLQWIFVQGPSKKVYIFCHTQIIRAVLAANFLISAASQLDAEVITRAYSLMHLRSHNISSKNIWLYWTTYSLNFFSKESMCFSIYYSSCSTRS